MLKRRKMAECAAAAAGGRRRPRLPRNADRSCEQRKRRRQRVMRRDQEIAMGQLRKRRHSNGRLRSRWDSRGYSASADILSRGAHASDHDRTIPGGSSNLAAGSRLAAPCRRRPRRPAHTSSLRENRRVRVEQRGEDILHDDQQTDPGHSPRRGTASRCRSHIAYSTTTPTMPHCTATLSVWLCGLPITWLLA